MKEFSDGKRGEKVQEISKVVRTGGFIEDPLWGGYFRGEAALKNMRTPPLEGRERRASAREHKRASQGPTSEKTPKLTTLLSESAPKV